MSYPPSGPQQPHYGPPQPPPQPPKKGMSTGGKIGLGCGGCLGLLLILALMGGCMAALSGDTAPAAPPAASSSPDTEESAAEEVEEEPAEEVSDVVLTATNAGTAGDVVDDTVYTVLDITVENGSEEDLEVNPIYFSVVLADGTVISDWANAIFADIDQLDAVTLSPGQRTEGQIAVVGEGLDIATVEMSELFGLQETVTADVS
ncbi:DUF4352 domain-containing protein [Nocardiopsis ganjiahuensis]|uniref:DUF4352 domain-containing protein n=1 Tax=Nocardiopsis ganjiahuensis TaxID=239984 RepID=UPI000475C10D|nr:DUF4352 domain-containing protein [Nocardiopsis ganjiahuensis]